ncbi:MAG: LysM peptidoglycan-binding domain-containing protein, partial [Gammaproteobacteria bacterium]|nr:LysM peptidoglycan-binding domain-containing protein [Gammaproteobacteria bacterium]
KTAEPGDEPAAVSAISQIEAETESYEDKLDYELDTALSDESGEDEIKDGQTKPWLAIAATIFVLLAAGVLFNALKSDKTTADQQVASAEVTPKNEALVVEEDVVAVIETEETEQLVSNNLTETVDELESTELQINDSVSEPVEEESIVVSSEKYDELKRASAEEDVFFSAIDHRLVNGDSLWRLARKHYVNPFYWPHIYQANQKKINNPDSVKIGRVVTLPTLYGKPDALTKQDRRNIAMGYYLNYIYHKQKGNPYAYFSLIGVDKFDADLLIEYRQEIERSDVDNLALLSE